MTITLDKETEALFSAHPDLTEKVAEFARHQAALFKIRSQRSPLAREVVREVLDSPITSEKERGELFDELESLIDEEISPHFVESEDGD